MAWDSGNQWWESEVDGVYLRPDGNIPGSSQGFIYLLILDVTALIHVYAEADLINGTGVNLRADGVVGDNWVGTGLVSVTGPGPGGLHYLNWTTDELSDNDAVTVAGFAQNPGIVNHVSLNALSVTIMSDPELPGHGSLPSTNTPPEFAGPSELTLALMPGQTSSVTLEATDAQTLSNRLFYYLMTDDSPIDVRMNSVTGEVNLHVPDDIASGEYTLEFSVADDDMDFNKSAETTKTIVIQVNRTPILGPMEDIEVDEGSVLQLQVPLEDDDEQSHIWEVVSDAPGLSIHPSTGVISWNPTDNAEPFEVSVTATDNGLPPRTGLLDFNVLVRNVAPMVYVPAPGDALRGESVSFTLTAADPSPVDQAAGFTFDIDWDDDGTIDETVVGPSGTIVEHVFEASGSHTVKVTATDKDGGTSEVAAVPVQVVAAIDAGEDHVGVIEGTSTLITVTHGISGVFTYKWFVDDVEQSGQTCSTFEFTPPDQGTYLVRVEATDTADSSVYSDDVTFFVDNDPPNPVIAGATADNEGNWLLFTIADFGDSGTLPSEIVDSYWSVTRNGVTYASPGSAPAYSFTVHDDGIYVVTLVVTDNAGATGTDTHTIVVANVAPNASVTTAAGPFVRGESVAVTLLATDPSSYDQAAGFTFDIDWDGDGTIDETVVGPSGTIVEHVFATSGSHTVKVTATDKDGDTSAIAERVVNVADWALRANAGNPSLNDLVWGGTTGDDFIEFVDDGESTVQILDGASQVILHSITGVNGNIIAHGYAGNDQLIGRSLDSHSMELHGGDGDDTLEGGLASDTITGGDGVDLIHADGSSDGAEGSSDWIDGGSGNDTIYADGAEGTKTGHDTVYGSDGNDTIYGDGAEGGSDAIFGGEGDDFINTGGGNDSSEGGAGDDILLGGDGAEGVADTLIGGDGRDILIGDGGGVTHRDTTGGSDSLNGGSGDDIILAGFLLAPDDLALLAIRQEWVSNRSYEERVANISGTGSGPRDNSDYFLTPAVNTFNDRKASDPPATTLVDEILGGDDMDWILLDEAYDTSDTELDELVVDLSAHPLT